MNNQTDPLKKKIKKKTTLSIDEDLINRINRILKINPNINASKIVSYVLKNTEGKHSLDWLEYFYKENVQKSETKEEILNEN